MEMSDQYTLIIEVISERELRKAYEELDDDKIQCKSMVETGLSGIRILYLEVTWVKYERGKFDQPKQYYCLY